jgi:hypothetical protein
VLGSVCIFSSSTLILMCTNFPWATLVNQFFAFSVQYGFSTIWSILFQHSNTTDYSYGHGCHTWYLSPLQGWYVPEIPPSPQTFESPASGCLFLYGVFHEYTVSMLQSYLFLWHREPKQQILMDRPFISEGSQSPEWLVRHLLQCYTTCSVCA